MSVNPPTSGPYPNQSTTSLNQASQEPTPGSCLPVFLGVLLVFCYLVAGVVFANFVPKIGPENLGTKLLVEGWPLIVGLLLLPVWINCLRKAHANFAGNDTSRWRKWILILTLVEVTSFVDTPLYAAKPVTDAISGPDVIAIKGCDNYSQTEFDLVTAEGEAIHFEFEDTNDEPELYVPLVKFCKDKGTSAVLKRYPNTEIVEDFQVK